MFAPGAPSLWLQEVSDTLPRWAPLPPGEHACDVLVVGAGLTGLACALVWQDRGAHVLMVDAYGPGQCASTRNAGFLLLGNATQYPALRAALGAAGAAAYLELGRETHRIIRDRFGDRCSYIDSGSLMLAMEDDPKEIETLHTAATLLRQDGVPCYMGEGSPEGLVGFGAALEIPEDGQLHPGELVRAMASEIEHAHTGVVDEVDAQARVAHAGPATLKFDHAFLCTNAYTSKLLKDDDRIVPQRGQVLATAPLPHRMDPVVSAGWGYDYFRQCRNGVVIVGGRRNFHLVAEQTDTPETTRAVQDDLNAYLERHLPFTRGVEITHRWAGIMGFTKTGLPIHERFPNPDGPVHLLAGFTGHGLGLAVGYATRIADGEDHPIAG